MTVDVQFDSWLGHSVFWAAFPNLSLRPASDRSFTTPFLRRRAAAVSGLAAGQEQCGNETAASAAVKATSTVYDLSQSRPSDLLYGCVSNDVVENISLIALPGSDK